jgi:RNA polymerase sigma-70 factor (sigma-E family)
VSGSDASNFEQFAEAEMQRLLNLAWVLTGNEHDAWDLVQDSLVKMKPKWSGINNRDNPVAYARRVLVNLNLNRLRRARREYLTAEPPDRAALVSESPASTEWLQEALRQLPARQRAAMTLAYVEDMPVAMIATILDCSQSTVKTHLARGREALRAAAPAHYSQLAGPDRTEVTT